MTHEVSRPISVDRLPASLIVEATAVECAALAVRLGIPDVVRLSCKFALTRRGVVVQADGQLKAEVVQSCVVSLEPVDQEVLEQFVVRFVPAGRESDDADPEAPDEIPYEGSIIDLGEAAAEQLALALDPYPRLLDAELHPAALDEAVNPFGSLSALRPTE